MKRAGPLIWLAAVIIVAVYLCFRLAGGIALESDILALLPRAERDASAQNVQDRIADAFSRRVVFLIGNKSPEKAAAAARQFSSALEHSGTIVQITSKIDPDAQRSMGKAYFPYRMGLLSTDDRKQLMAGNGAALESRALSILYGGGSFANASLFSRDPFFLMPAYFMSLPLPQSRLTLDGDVLSVRDHGITYVLVSANLAGNPYALDFQDKFERAVSDAIAPLKAATPDLTVLRTGAIFYAHDGAKEAAGETSIIGLASIIGTLALIFLVFHGLRPILLGFIAIGVGILCAFVGTLLIFGKIHTVALLFGVSLIGISVDYSLQYFCEYFDPAASDPESRLRRVLPGVAVGLTTTLIGYCTLLLAPFPGLRQVAAFSVIGLSASFLTVALWYPILDSKKAPSHGQAFLRAAARHWRLWEAPRHGVLRVAILALCIAGTIGGFLRLKADDDVRHLQSLPAALKQQEAEIERLTGAPTGAQFLLVRGKSEQALLQTEEQVAPNLAQAQRAGDLDGYTAMADFVPSVARQKRNRELVRTRLIEPYLANYLQQVGFREKVDYGDGAGYLVPADLPKTGPFSLLPVLDVGTPANPAHVVLLHGVKNIAGIEKRVAGITGVRMVSLADDWSHLFGNYRRYAIALLALSVLLMYPLLAWRYGWGQGMRVLLPSVAAVTMTAPLAALMGVSFTFFNAMALVLVLSVGVDYAVFCCETSGERKSVTTLAIALAAISTILSLGMLAFSKVFAVHAFGVTMLIGIFLSFLFAPAAGDATSWQAKKREA